MRERRMGIVLGWIAGMVFASASWAAMPSVAEVQRLLREGRAAEASTMAAGLLAADPGNLELLRLAAEAARTQNDGRGAAAFLCQATEHGGTAEDFLALAGIYRGLFDLDHTLSTYETAAGRFPTPEVYRAWSRALLDFRLTAEARRCLDGALAKFPADVVLPQIRAALAHEEDHHAEAVQWIRTSWANGADHLAWTRDPVFHSSRTLPPYTSLLSATEVLSGTRALEPADVVDRLRLLAPVMDPASAPAVVGLLTASRDTEVWREGLADLMLLKTAAAPQFRALLSAYEPGLRRETLFALRELSLPEFVPLLAEYLPSEMAPGNHDFAEVLLVQLQAGNRLDSGAAALFEALPATNAYRFLALYRLADIYRSLGQAERATKALEAAEAGRPVVQPPAGSQTQPDLEAFWECKQRLDIEEVLPLLERHRYLARIDARVYGLPENDFDDQQNLSIAERLFLRSWARRQGLAWPTEGMMQYPREIRHTLERIYSDTKMVPDCSGFLVKPEDEPVSRILQKDGNELKLFEDTGGDNEVNIAVNPYAQQYVIATSNGYSSTQNETYRSSNYGKTWTHGALGQGSSACDPVSFYNRNQTLYHSYLNYAGGVYVSYSTNQGSTWTACATVATGGVDREDMYIDTFAGDGGSWSASPCVDKVYVGWHLSGAQKFRASSGTSSPFCNTWGTAVSLSGNGTANTIGTAITSSIGKNTGSGRGTVIDIFSRYTSGPGIFYSLSTDCGASLGTPVLIASTYANAFEWGIPSTCSRQEYIYPQADSDRQPLSAFRNNVYAVWNDLSSACTPPGCSGNSTCNSDIYVAKGVPNSRDNPTSWTWTTVNLTKTVIGTDNYTDEFYPSIAVDQADGDVYVSYYRSNSGASSITPRQQQVHYVVVRSINGGTNWQTAYQVTQLPTNEYNSGADSSMQWGDYTWVDAINGVCYPVWTDRREAADEDIWAGKVCSEPTHWVERGASPAVPPTTCANGGSAGQVTVSWTAPDIYWGDGGESSASRKYQLYVDGALATDNILWTATSSTYTASNCTASHTYQVRAVNSCGVTKSYGTTTFTPSNCASTPLRVPYSATPTRIVKNNATATDINVTWDPTNCPSSDYHIIWGDGSSVATLATSSPTVSGGKCDLGTTGALSNWSSGVPAPSSGAFVWFLVVGDNNGTTEGSWGLITAGSAERGGTAASGQCTCTTKSTSGSCGTT